MEKSCRKHALKASSRPLFLFWQTTQNSYCMQEILLKIGYLERGLLKTFKKVNFIFLSNPVPFNGRSYEKQKRPGTSDQSFFRLRKKFTKISLLVRYYLIKFDAVI